MKAKTIKITSLKNTTTVAIRNGNKESKVRRFPDINTAIDYVLPCGNRHTILTLNGHKCVLNGWV